MLMKNMKVHKTRMGFLVVDCILNLLNSVHISNMFLLFIIVNHSHRSDKFLMFSEFLTITVSHCSCLIFTR
jgi:hypothetical protein